MGFVVRKDRTMSGIGKRAVLQHLDGESDCTERAATAGEQLLCGTKDVKQGRVITRLLFRTDDRAAQGASASVNGNDRGGGA